MARVAAAFALQHVVDRPPGRLCLIDGDAEGYWILADAIVQGRDYAIYTPPRYVLRMPGFPLVLALPRAIAPDSVVLARVWLALLGTLACLAVYELGRALGSRGAGLFAAGYLSLAPTHVVFSVLLLSESVFMLTMTVALFTAVRWYRSLASGCCLRATSAWAVTAGAAAAMATYVRPTWAPVIGVAALLVWIAQRCSARALLSAFTAVAVFAIALSPWVIRNYAVTGHLVPTTLWMGASLYDGWNPQATGDSEMTFFDQENLLAKHSEYAVNRIYRDRAVEFARQNPGRVLELAFVKLRRYFSLVPNAPQFQSPGPWWACVVSTLPLLAAVPGFLWNWRRPLLWLPTAGPLLFFAAVHLVFVASLRYRLPAEGPLAVLAGLAFVAVWTRLRSRVA